MATLNTEILETAFNRGELDGRAYHHEQQVETLNYLLSRIQAQEIDSFTLHKEAKLNHCTVLIYCRYLASKGLIKITHKGQGGICRYQAIK